MIISPCPVPGVLLIEPKRFGDERGSFCETFRADALAAAGFATPFVQDNCARSAAGGVVRGLHMQRGAAAQDKLVRCSRGAIFDVAVDLRPGSATFGRVVCEVLSAVNWLQLLVPAGFAHGYCTLEPETEVLYKVTRPYAPDQEEGLLWSDPGLDVAWPASAGEAIVNARDAALPTQATWAGMMGLSSDGRPLR